MISCAGSIGEPMPPDFGGFPKTNEEQILEQLREIKELLRRQDPTSIQPTYVPYPVYPQLPQPYWNTLPQVVCFGTFSYGDSV